MAYACYHYTSLKELMSQSPNLVGELKAYFNEGQLNGHHFCIYPTLEDYASYELLDGAFKPQTTIAAFAGISLTDFVDLAAFGGQLTQHWEPSTHFYSQQGRIIVIE